MGNDFSEFVKCTEEVLVLEGPFLCQYCLSTINQIFQKLECCINIGLFSVFLGGRGGVLKWPPLSSPLNYMETGGGLFCSGTFHKKSSVTVVYYKDFNVLV